MKVGVSLQNLANIKDVPAIMKYLSPWVQQVSDAINGPQLTITDNLALNILSVVFGSANTTVNTAHKLGVKPTGYVLVGATAAMSLYNGTGSTNASQISLQSSGAGTATVLIF